MAIEGHGGDLIAEALRAHGIDLIYTLSGGHVFPIYDGMHRRGMTVVDVRHELTAGFAAEAQGKLTRAPGVAVATAGPGVINAMNAVVTAQSSGTPMVLLGGRAPVARWGWGSLQEMDHLPVFGPVTKRAETVFDVAQLGARVSDALTLAGSRHRGAVFVDFPADVVFLRTECEAPTPAREAEGPVEGDLDALAEALGAAERPMILLGSDVWMEGAEKAARELVERHQIAATMSGMGRGVLPSDHPMAFNLARANAPRADLLIVAGTPLDFRVRFGEMGAERLAHVMDDAARIGRHAKPAFGVAGPLTTIFEALAQAVPRERDAWIAEMRRFEEDRRAGQSVDADLDAVPIHPMRIYRELVPRIPDGAVIVADGGDFSSYAGRFIEISEPGTWLDPGPFGCLGVSPGYALAAGMLERGRRIVVLLGDGAAGFSMGDWDTLVRFGIDVTFVCGNNGIWGLEKHPQQFLYGHSVAAELRPETRYDEVMRGLGGHGELVGDPADIGPALDRALATPGPSLVNVITDPSIAYQRQAAVLL